MGTSTSQPSPDTPSWRIARELLGREAAPIARQSEEIWKAAANDRNGRLFAELSSRILAAASSVASEVSTPAEAVRVFNSIVAEQRSAGLVLDMGRRALVRAVSTEGGAAAFGAELFAEAASYYTARDLSSYVASAGRVPTSSAAIHLKESIKAIARGAARESVVRSDAEGWSSFIHDTIGILTRRSGGAPATGLKGPPRPSRGSRGKK